ncbi:hypothetical protein I6E52_00900 [Salinibacterium sp. NG253]|uniref:hypothetical protein n=1 Tax=Salinibacterium sp. NG253 TaxID=2792039 RepID=UPI0018CF5E4C|nr:hypothetical protein [Salinibacterium sp. NG253]MBH0115402.1 hypothetical protein [Salinibacterium sp. NG253]
MTATFTLKATPLRIVTLTESAKASHGVLPVAAAATVLLPTPIGLDVLSDSSSRARPALVSAAS